MPASQVEEYIDPDNLDRQIRKLHRGMVITAGHYGTEVPGTLADLEWNFYDEVHRIYVHGTYDGMFKVFAGKTFSVNVVRLGSLPLLIQVANAKIAPGLFYQTMSILSILYCHQIVSMAEVAEGTIHLDRRWYTASHWLFRPLHGLFNRMLMRLQEKQENEDNAEIRGRRYELRRAGFRFATDDPDFQNSNKLLDHVIFPEGGSEIRVRISDILPQTGMERRVSVGPLEMLLRREENSVQVWPGICPHEGALLDFRHRCSDSRLQCPWHGRRFPGTKLQSDTTTEWRFLNFRIGINGDDLVVRRIV